MAEFTRVPARMAGEGVNLSLPADLVPDGRWPVRENCRSYLAGTIQPRPGVSQINAVALADLSVHSVRRLNDPTPFATRPMTRLVGAGANLYSGPDGALALIGGGYSGKPLTLVPILPDQAPQPWMVVADSSKMAKVNVDSVATQGFGIAPPTVAPTAAFAAPNFTLIDGFEALGTWTASGHFGAPTVELRTNTTIAVIRYDVGNTGWCSIVPTLFNDSIQPKVFLTIGAEVIQVQRILPPANPTLVSAISYDSGVTGLCTVQAQTSADAWDRDTFLTIGGEVGIRLLSVTTGPDGSRSFRCVTTANHGVGEAINTGASFRAYTVGNHAAGEAIVNKCFKAIYTPPSPAPASDIPFFRNAVALDLTVVGNRPIHDDDEIHLSMWISGINELQSGRICFNTDATDLTFQSNFYYYEFRASDLQVAAVSVSFGQPGRQTVLDARRRAIQRNQIDQPLSSPVGPEMPRGRFGRGMDEPQPPEPPEIGPAQLPTSGQIGTGESQWMEVVFKVKDLIRVGTDLSRILQTVTAIQLEFTLAFQGGTQAATVQVDSLWFGGTYGLDVGAIGAPYVWTYRGRNSSTGAVSNPSPAMRTGLLPHRERVLLTGTQHPDAQVDKIDWFRYGGVVTQWIYVGTSPNSNPPTFTDDFPDSAIANAPLLEFDNFQPWPTSDLPRRGSCNVAGTTVLWASGDVFNVAWSAGTQIVINNVPYTLYASPSSTIRLEIVENGGSQTGVAFLIQEPTLQGQPLPSFWGDYEGFYFGCGDPNNPGRLYYTKGNQPENAPDNYTVDVTTPTEPLIAGGMYDQRPYVFSSDQLYAIEPTGSQTPPIFRKRQTPVGKGLWSRWAVCWGTKIWYVVKDGIEASDGTNSESITRDDLYPLFPHDGNPGVSVRGFYPPDMTVTTALRLSEADGWLYFDYQDSNGAKRTLAYHIASAAWEPDVYTPGMLMHYGEEGSGVHSLLLAGADGRLYQSGGASDAGIDIAGKFWTPAKDVGDPRAQKVFGDFFLNLDPANLTITVVAGFNAFATTLAAVLIGPGVSGRTAETIDINAGLGQFADNAGLQVSWSGQATPIFYVWELSYVPKPELTLKRATDWEDFGKATNVRGVILQADTAGLARTVNILADGAVSQGSIVVTDQAQGETGYAFDGVSGRPAPFVTHLVRLSPQDANQWRLFPGWKWITDDYPEYSTLTTEWQNGGTDAAKFIQGFRLTGDTQNLAVVIDIQIDGGTLQQTFTATHNGVMTKAYPDSVTPFDPFIAHQMRLVLHGAMRKFQVEWIWEPVPELATVWTTQGTTYDLPGYHTHRDAFIAHQSTADILAQLTLDTTIQRYRIPSSGGVYKRSYLPLQPNKATLTTWRWSSDNGFRLFLRDCSIRVKSWGDPGPFQSVRLFGDVHRAVGARI